MKTIKIDEATCAQLVAFATTALNIDGVSTSMSKAQVIAKIKAVGHDKDTIEVDAPAVTTEAAPTPVAKDMVKLMIPASDQPGGSDPVPVGVNGSVMLIPRDEWCQVPRPYAHALSNAVRLVYSPLKDGGLSEPKKVPAYPFQTAV